MDSAGRYAVAWASEEWPGDEWARRLCEELLARGLVEERLLRQAVGMARRSGSRLGDVLVALGAVRRTDLYHVLADVTDHPFVELSTVEVDENLLRGTDPSEGVRAGWLPYHREPDGTVLVATVQTPTAEFRRGVEARVGAPVRLSITTAWDLLRTVQQHHREALKEGATFRLWTSSPESSARRVLSRPQRAVGVLVLVGLLVLGVWHPMVLVSSVSLALAFGFALSVVFKFFVCMAGARRDRRPPVRSAPPPVDADLPTYTVLVPCYPCCRSWGLC